MYLAMKKKKGYWDFFHKGPTSWSDPGNWLFDLQHQAKSLRLNSLNSMLTLVSGQAAAVPHFSIVWLCKIMDFPSRFQETV